MVNIIHHAVIKMFRIKSLNNLKLLKYDKYLVRICSSSFLKSLDKVVSLSMVNFGHPLSSKNNYPL